MICVACTKSTQTLKWKIAGPWRITQHGNSTSELSDNRPWKCKYHYKILTLTEFSKYVDCILCYSFDLVFIHVPSNGLRSELVWTKANVGICLFVPSFSPSNLHETGRQKFKDHFIAIKSYWHTGSILVIKRVVIRGSANTKYILKSCRRFHKTLPNLRLILGLRTSPNPALWHADLKINPKLGRVTRPNSR